MALPPLGIPAPVAPANAVPASALHVPPLPSDPDGGWGSITLGPYSFPPVAGQGGVVRLNITSKVKVDKQTAAGKSKSKTKVGGKDSLDAELEVEWTDQIWTAGCQFTSAIDPNGPSGGDPLAVTHPEATRRGLSRIVVKEAGKLDIEKGSAGNKYKQTFKLQEWTPPDNAAQAGATTTPETATPGSQFNSAATSYSGGQVGEFGKGTTSFGGKPSGFNGSNAPSAAAGGS